MGIDQRLPDLSDKELETLHANAVRLVQSGSAAQREEAEALLPLLGEALETRRAARAAEQTETRRANARKRAVIAELRKEERGKSDDVS